MRRILVTNDDGYRSEGITALADAVKFLGDVFIVAPMTEASAIGHALTLRHPLRLEHMGEQIPEEIRGRRVPVRVYEVATGTDLKATTLATAPGHRSPGQRCP